MGDCCSKWEIAVVELTCYIWSNTKMNFDFD